MLLFKLIHKLREWHEAFYSRGLRRGGSSNNFFAQRTRCTGKVRCNRLAARYVMANPACGNDCGSKYRNGAGFIRRCPSSPGGNAAPARDNSPRYAP